MLLFTPSICLTLSVIHCHIFICFVTSSFTVTTFRFSCLPIGHGVEFAEIIFKRAIICDALLQSFCCPPVNNNYLFGRHSAIIGDYSSPADQMEMLHDVGRHHCSQLFSSLKNQYEETTEYRVSKSNLIRALSFVTTRDIISSMFCTCNHNDNGKLIVATLQYPLSDTPTYVYVTVCLSLKIVFPIRGFLLKLSVLHFALLVVTRVFNTHASPFLSPRLYTFQTTHDVQVHDLRIPEKEIVLIVGSRNTDGK